MKDKLSLHLNYRSITTALKLPLAISPNYEPLQISSTTPGTKCATTSEQLCKAGNFSNFKKTGV